MVSTPMTTKKLVLYGQPVYDYKQLILKGQQAFDYKQPIFMATAISTSGLNSLYFQ